ncbi:MAG: hypothetical protein ACR2MM_06675, partial [Flavobacteriaceae bacterium]
MTLSSKFNRLSKSRTFIFGTVLLFLAFAMATAIFSKQSSVTPDIPFGKVLVWQMILWIPLVLVLPAFR